MVNRENFFVTGDDSFNIPPGLTQDEDWLDDSSSWRNSKRGPSGSGGRDKFIHFG